MLDKLLEFIKTRLDIHLKTDNSTTDTIAFTSELPTDAVKLPNNAIIPLIIHIEEDKRFLLANRHIRETNIVLNGKTENPIYEKYTVKPPIALNALLLFVANYANYVESAKRLSQIILYFQDNAYFTKDHYRDLHDSMPEVTIELYPSTLTTQNEIWSMLKAPYRPSVLYRVKLLMVETPVIPVILKPIDTIEVAVKDTDIVEIKDEHGVVIRKELRIHT